MEKGISKGFIFFDLGEFNKEYCEIYPPYGLRVKAYISSI